MARVGEAVLQSAIGGQHQQTFAVSIETPGGIDVGDRYKIPERRRFTGKLTQNVVRLVKEQVAVPQCSE